ncbi:MAG: acyltransferase [Acidimicrobiales bacterium]
MSAPTEQVARVPAFDSLRAIAVTLVFATHLWAVFPFGLFGSAWTKSGFLGVDLFFVLSGFLITSLLLREHDKRGSIRFGQFYARRALRLMPALLFFFAVYLTYSAIEGWPPFGRRDFAFGNFQATLLYYMNWRVLDSPLKAGDLTAFWSLSIEEQFYWVWPLALVGLLWFAARRGDAIVWLIGAAAVASTLWRVFVYHRWGWEAAYLRTDARLDGLLWGALAAVLFLRGRLRRELPRWTPLAVGVLWVVLLITVRADGRSAYYGGITLWVLSSAVLIVYFANRPDRFATGPVAVATQGVGRVSYALYLWQLPVLRAVERWTPDWAVGWRVAASTVLLAVCAVVSWFLVERPALAVKARLQVRWRALSATAVAG